MTARHHTQLTSGRFYVHRSKKNHKKFKQPNFIALDITWGSPFECFGGLLIIEIKNVGTDEEVNECAKVLNRLISGREETKLISKKWIQDDLNSFSELDDSSIFDCQLSLMNSNSVQTIFA